MCSAASRDRVLRKLLPEGILKPNTSYPMALLSQVEQHAIILVAQGRHLQLVAHHDKAYLSVQSTLCACVCSHVLGLTPSAALHDFSC